jgi:TolB-like protein
MFVRYRELKSDCSAMLRRMLDPIIMTTNLKRTSRLICLGMAFFFLFLFGMDSGGLIAAEPTKLALLPLRIHTDKELLYLRDGINEILNSRLFVPGRMTPLSRQAVVRLIPAAPVEVTESSARDLGRRLGVDYILFGSVTLPGQGISLDLRMADVAGRRPMKSFSNQVDQMDGIIPCIERLAEDIQTWILEPSRLSRSTQAPSSVTVQQGRRDAEASQRHPEELFKKELAQSKNGQAAVASETPAALEAALPARENPPSSEKPPHPVAGAPGPNDQTIASANEASIELWKQTPPAAQQPVAPHFAAVLPESPAGAEGLNAWTILIASERTEDEAQRTAVALQQQGYAVRVARAQIPVKGIWYRVLTGDFASKADTQEMVERLRRSGLKPTPMPIQTVR